MAQNHDENRVYIILAVLALALVGFFTYLYNQNDAWKWGENYEQDNKNPYGLHIMHTLMSTYFPKGQFKKIETTVAKDLPATTVAPANYVFMGAAPYYDSTDIARLTAFVRNGNTAMIITKSLPNEFISALLKPYRSAEYLDNEAAMKAIKAAEDKAAAEESNGFSDISPTTPPEIVEYDETDTSEHHEAFVDEDLENVDIDSLIAAREAASDDGLVIPGADDNAENSSADASEDAENDPNTPQWGKRKYVEPSELIFPEKNDTSANLQLKNTKAKPVKYVFHYRKKADDYDWRSINLDALTDNTDGNIAILGTIDGGKPNFVRINYGKGAFYLHCTPLAFTNYYLLHEAQKNYAEQVLNYLPNAKTWWDEPSKTERYSGDSDAFMPELALDYKGPFDFILSQPSLKWAWYMIWGLVALFLVFRAKRRQRIIPVNEPNVNSSLQFVQNIGRLYFLKNNHKQLGEQKMRFFMHTLRHRFGLPTHLPKAELIPRIVQKTGIAEAHISAIFSQADYINYAGEISTDDLIELHNALQIFYQKIG
jgi:hypothetical protein